MTTCDGCSEPRHLLARCEIKVVGEPNWIPADYCIDCVETALDSVAGHAVGVSFNGMSETYAIRGAEETFCFLAPEDFAHALEAFENTIMPDAWPHTDRFGSGRPEETR